MSVRIMTGCVVVVGLLIVVGCDQGPTRLKAPPINPSAAGAKAIELYDTDKDGKISGDELEKCPALKSALAQIDTANTGGITADMITARIKEWQESKVAVMPFTCIVLRNGQPLAGADVALVPEKFLADVHPTGTGKTSDSGEVMASAPKANPADPPGVPPGLYRIEITKAGDNIPAKYNTETTFGKEVAQGAAGGRGVLSFNLEY